MATEHTSLATKYRPQTWEDVCGQETVKQILKYQVDTNTFKQGYLMAGHFGCGKACTLDSHILGKDGYFKMRDAKVGMEIWGEDGQLHHIVGVFPQGKKECYRIYFSDNTYAECCIDHLWNIRKQGCQVTSGPHRWFTKSTRWLLQQELWSSDRVDDKGHKNNQRRFCIPVTKPLNFSEAELPIDPYLLGQFIADGAISEGTGGSLQISLYEDDVMHNVEALLLQRGIGLRNYDTTGKNRDYSLVELEPGSKVLTKFRQDLEALDLRKKSVDKHIPKLYLYSSFEQRLRLLQGLMDGDGSIQDGQYTYSTSSKQLYEDIKFLIQSMGGLVNVRGGKQSFRKLDSGERVYYGNNWEFAFHFPDSVIPFTSQKHTKRYGGGSKFKHAELYRFIDRIEPIGEQECQCIMTDNPEGLYLMDEMIVTHNTTCARIFAKMINGGPYDIIEIDAATYNSVDQIRTIADAAKQAPLVGKYKIFIIDEAHMLSQAANNAFLKLLEEPPATAIFILCTTDPQKLLNTILSRVQRYDFTSIPTEEIVGRLKYISDKENIKIDEPSIKFIAKLANGGMRDSISMLDKVHSVSDNITLDQVANVLSVVSYHEHLDLLKALIEKDTKAATEIVCRVSESGKDMRQFVNQFMWCVCDVCNQFIFRSYDYINIPELPEYTAKIQVLSLDACLPILDWARGLANLVRNDPNPKNNILVEVMIWTQRK